MPEWQYLSILFQYPLARLINADYAELTNEEYVYATHSWTLLDFMLYDTTTKQPILVIEVDGVSFHKKGSVQWNRDQLKNSVLGKMFSRQGRDKKIIIIFAIFLILVFLGTLAYKIVNKFK